MTFVRRFYEEVGRRLRRARLDADLTQQDLAVMVDMSRASIANIEAGRQPFPSHMLVVFARALGLSAEDLLPGAGVLDSETRLPEDAIRGFDEPSKNWVRKILAPTQDAV